MSEKIVLKNGQECVLKVHGKHLDLGGNLHQRSVGQFTEFCDKHSFHPSSATLTFEKEGDAFVVRMNMHAFGADLHSESKEHADVYAALGDVLHVMYQSATKAKEKSK